MDSAVTCSVEVVHCAVPGRTRLKAAWLRGRAERALDLKGALRDKPGITACSTDIRTGTVLIHHQPAVTTSFLHAFVQELAPGLAAQHQPPPVRPTTSDSRPNQPVSSGSSTLWHSLDGEEVLRQLATNPQSGLSADAVAARRGQWGTNRLSVVRGRSDLEIFLDQLISLPVAMLGGSATLSIATRSFFDAFVTIGVVATNAVIGWATESGAQRLIGRITSADVVDASVIRDGREHRLAAHQLVPGDVLVLRRGDPVPADARLLESHTLSVNESLLTGESAAQLKDASARLSAATPLADRTNLVFMGTTVAGGSGIAIVIATGNRTEIGRIQALAGATVAPQPPIARDLDHLGRDLAIGALLVCGIAFSLGVLRGHPWLQILKSAIALAVAAVPEGLPAIATSTLALGLRRMRSEHMLVRRLDAVEGLGSLNVLCLDKTGTLTENRMQVTAAALDGRRWSLDQDESQPASLAALARYALLATESAVTDVSEQTLEGLSGTERAIVEFAQAIGTDIDQLNGTLQRRGTRLRDDAHNFVAVDYADDDSGLVAIKGRPSEVLNLCENVARNGDYLPLSDGLRIEINRENERLAAEGLRVLGVAYARGASRMDLDGNLTWCGLIAMHDPLRPNSAAAIEQFQRAGVRTIMITGDQAPTAAKAARELNLAADEPLQILDASDLEQIDPGILEALAKKTHVFARVSPATKLEVVQALQRGGAVVGMTGDGINDGPALKAADVGIAMGRSGARIARDVADVVIQDDNLEHLIEGIAEGRTILANIRKSIHFLLSTNLSEIFVIFAEILRGPRELESPMELFWINLVTDIFPSIGLALEPPAPDVLERPPRSREEPLIDGAYYRQLAKEATVIGGTSLVAHFYGIARYGTGPRTRSVTFFSLVAAQLLHTITCRRDRFQVSSTPAMSNNPGLVSALIGSAALQALPMFVPPLRRLLGIGPIGPLDLAVIAGTSATSYFLNERLTREEPPPEAAQATPEYLSSEISEHA